MKKYISFLSAVLVFCLSGCIKDKGFDDNKYQSLRYSTDGQKLISVALTTTFSTANPEFNVSLTPLNSSAVSQVINLVPITISGGIPAEQDVHVVVDTSSTILTAYNTNPNGAHGYELPSSSVYSIISKNITIPKGQTTGYVQIRLKPDDLIAGPTAGIDGFAIPIKIVSVDGGYAVAANRGQGIAAFVIKNQYDGKYSVVSGFVTRFTNPTTIENPSTLNGSLNGNPDVNLTTAGANSVIITGLQWRNGSGQGIAGIDGLTAMINPVTNLVTMTASGNATLANWEGKVNKYDPATKTFYLAYRWNPNANRREYEVVLRYKSPR